MTNNYASRAGSKLDFALTEFNIDVTGKICADLGCSTGGFTDCLLQHGAVKVYSVDTGYGVLDWSLRQDSRVVVMERTNALFVTLPELVDFISIDVSWTRQKLIVPKAFTLLKPGGIIISLLKPHYEAAKHQLLHGQVKPEASDGIISSVVAGLGDIGVTVKRIIQSPVLGEKGKNTEYLMLLQPSVSSV